MSERRGIIFILISAGTSSLFPIIGKLSSAQLPPFIFGGLSLVCASAVAGLWLLLKQQAQWAALKKHWQKVAMISVLTIILPFTFFYIGVGQTSGLHATILLLFEIPFTVLITPLFGEPTTKKKLLGSGLIFFGAAATMWQGGWQINLGDLLIIASTIFYPLGNFYSKKCLHYLKPGTLVLARSLFGAVILLLGSLVFEHVNISQVLHQGWWLILVNGVLVFGIGKLLFFTGFRSLDISKAIPLLKTAPLFSLLLVVLILHEPISWHQWLGALVMLLGAYITILRKSTPLEQTRYVETPTP